MKIYKISKIITSSINGEWWISDGSAQFADGDIGDMSHEGIVMATCANMVLSELDIHIDEAGLLGEHEDLITERIMDEDEDFVNNYLNQLDVENVEDLAEFEKKEYLLEDPAEVMMQYLKQEGVEDAQEIVLMGYGSSSEDVRLYALKKWGWKRVLDNDVQTWTFSENDFRDIKSGLWEIVRDERDDSTMNLEVVATSKYYTKIPLSDFLNGSYRDVLDHLRGRALGKSLVY